MNYLALLVQSMMLILYLRCDGDATATATRFRKREIKMATNTSAVSYEVDRAESRSVPNAPVILLGRFLFAAIFLMSSIGHFSAKTIGYAASQGVPLAQIAVPASGLLALAGGM